MHKKVTWLQLPNFAFYMYDKKYSKCLNYGTQDLRYLLTRVQGHQILLSDTWRFLANISGLHDPSHTFPLQAVPGSTCLTKVYQHLGSQAVKKRGHITNHVR